MQHKSTKIEHAIVTCIWLYRKHRDCQYTVFAFLLECRLITVKENILCVTFRPQIFRHSQVIKSIYSLWSIGHPWRASKHCGLQLFPWPHSMIFLCFLSQPLLSFAPFSSAYLSFHIPEESNLMQFFLFLLFLYVMCVQFHFLLFIWFSIVLSS